MVLTEVDCGFSKYFGANFNVHGMYKIQLIMGSGIVNFDCGL